MGIYIWIWWIFCSPLAMSPCFERGIPKDFRRNCIGSCKIPIKFFCSKPAPSVMQVVGSNKLFRSNISKKYGTFFYKKNSKGGLIWTINCTFCYFLSLIGVSILTVNPMTGRLQTFVITLQRCRWSIRMHWIYVRNHWIYVRKLIPIWT